MNSNQLRIAFVVLASMAGGVALAEDGVTDKAIVFGQVAALTGPAQDLGQGMRQGILAAFEDANRGGGIAGRTLTYGPGKNQGSDQVFFTILQADGTFKPVTRLAKMAGQ